MDPAAPSGDFRARNIHQALLGVVHHGHPRRYALADHRAGGERAVGVEGLDPVVIFDTQLAGVGFADPHDWPAARQGQHQQVFAVGGVDAPFLVRRQEVERFFREAIGRDRFHLADAAGVNRRTINHQAFAKGAHPGMILIQLLAAGKGAPGDQLVDVGIAGVIGDMLALEAGPGRAGDDFARLGLNIAEADFFILFIARQVRVLAAGKLAERLPGFYRHLAVGFRGEGEDHFRGVDGAVDARSAFRRAVQLDVVKLAEEIDFALGVPRNAFAAIAQLVE